MITIHQIPLISEMAQIVNSTGDTNSVSAFAARMNVSFFGSDKFIHADFKFYKETIKVDSDDLEVAFEATNLWNMPNITERLVERTSSTSVGDIFEKNERFFMVDGCGFSEIYFFADELV